MNCPDPDMWTRLSLGLLDEAEGERLLKHAGQCPSCRTALAEARRDHATCLRTFEVFDRAHDSQREQLMAVLPVEVPPGGQHWLRGITMSISQHKARWAAATLLPAACITMLFVLFFVTGTEVAFAEVLERMRQARTMRCEFATESEVQVPGASNEPTETRTSVRGRLTMYCDGQTRATRMDAVEPPHIQWNLPDRMVVARENRVEVVILGTGPEQDGPVESADQWLDRMLEECDRPDRELGTKVLGGRKVAGFEIAGWRLGLGAKPTEAQDHETPASAWVWIWVDVEDKLPVQMEYEQEVTAGAMEWRLHSRWDNIEWNVPLDPADFVPPEPTEGDSVVDLGLPPVTEQSFVEALQVWREDSQRMTAHLDRIEKRDKSGGDEEWLARLEDLREQTAAGSPFPPNLGLQYLTIAGSARQAFLLAAARAASDDSAELPAAEGGAEQTPTWAPLAFFYRKLVMEGHEPEYFGTTAIPDDADSVLLRWNLDDHTQRVIYADLHAETLAGGE